MADNGARSRAAEYVDADHRRHHDALKASHKKWERNELNHELGRINSIKQNRDEIDARYVQRVKTIQSRKESVALTIQRRHTSIAGRLEALTPKGRARQAETWRRLDERAENLELRAGKKHQMQLAQHDRHVQTARISAARTINGSRGQNRDALQEHHQKHIERRPDKIHACRRELQQEKLAELRSEMKHEWQQQVNKPPSQTVQHKR
jgi:hypothetical protein